MRSNMFLTVITTMVLLLVLVLPITASDYTLGIFGNANEDDTINMQDVTYTELIILEYKDKTQLADAKYDGEVDILDVTQIELIILGMEKELTLIDSMERTITLKKPIERIVVMNNEPAEIIRALGSDDKIIGVSKWIAEDEIFFSEFSNLPDVGTGSAPDCEKIIEIKPDILIYYAFWPMQVQALEEKLESVGTTVVCLDCFYPQTMTGDVKKLSYVLGKKDDEDSH